MRLVAMLASVVALYNARRAWTAGGCHHHGESAGARRRTVCSRKAVLARSDPRGVGRNGAAFGSTGLDRGSVGCRPARRARTSDAHPSRAADGRPDLAVRAGGRARFPRAGLAYLVGP